MEILHFCPSKSFSGLEQYAIELADDQKKRGLEVGFMVAPDSRLQKECLKKGLTTLLYDDRRFLGGVKYHNSLNELVSGDPKLKIFHLHSTQEVAHIAPVIFGRKYFGRKVPKIILQVHIWINHKRKDPLHRWLYSLVDELWCSSVPAKEALLKKLPIPEEKIKIVNYGRDVEKLRAGFFTRDEARSRLGLPAAALVIGTVSRFEKSKGIKEFLLAALPLMRQKTDLHLALIGSASPNNREAEDYEKQLMHLKKSLEKDIQERIHFLGAVADSFQFLKAFDLYVLPSYEECFSLSLLDAQAAGIPTVGGLSGGTPEIVQEGKTGWLFEPKSHESLQKALTKALAQKSKWQELGQTAQDRVFKDFDQKLIFESVLKEYDSSQ